MPSMRPNSPDELFALELGRRDSLADSFTHKLSQNLIEKVLQCPDGETLLHIFPEHQISIVFTEGVQIIRVPFHMENYGKDAVVLMFPTSTVSVVSNPV